MKRRSSEVKVICLFAFYQDNAVVALQSSETTEPNRPIITERPCTLAMLVEITAVVGIGATIGILTISATVAHQYNEPGAAWLPGYTTLVGVGE